MEKEQAPLNKRKKQAIETKERIYNATLELIADKGINNVLMEDITRKAGVSSGLFYNYFASRADVLTEAFSYRGKNFYAAMENEYLKELRGIEKLRSIIHYVSKLRQEIYDKEELRYHHTNLLKMPDRMGVTQESNGKLVEMIAQSIEEARELGEISPDADARAIEDMIMLVIRGATWEYLTREGSYPFEQKVWGIVSHYLIANKKIAR